ncbi:hypothetical protein IscW_ISCW001938 [Ixodes scapularis]|uniref:Uncharacterized protein n=1 Tax=Ixodes scapularis TaxID=6945 RepID=B7P7K4_IXOSC|nr:hypothetical protein IscW_ISCW001938 [Ixodes scapularis]|eukprot:XP_002399269.1 hypothetical protein IscW_ISCW001938 [Ixodes scapularis]
MHLIERANTISVRTDLKELAEYPEKFTVVTIEEQNIPVQVFRTYGATCSHGVLYNIYPVQEDPQDDTLNNEIECDKIHVVAARRLGNHTSILPFDSEKLPTSASKPKAVAYSNCHRNGHKDDICPNGAVSPR